MSLKMWMLLLVILPSGSPTFVEGGSTAGSVAKRTVGKDRVLLFSVQGSEEVTLVDPLGRIDRPAAADSAGIPGCVRSYPQEPGSQDSRWTAFTVELPFVAPAPDLATSVQAELELAQR